MIREKPDRKMTIKLTLAEHTTEARVLSIASGIVEAPACQVVGYKHLSVEYKDTRQATH
jgi:hypothetical protein